MVGGFSSAAEGTRNPYTPLVLHLLLCLLFARTDRLGAPNACAWLSVLAVEAGDDQDEDDDDDDDDDDDEQHDDEGHNELGEEEEGEEQEQERRRA